MAAHEGHIHRAGIIGTLVVLAIGGLLLVATTLASFGTRPFAPQLLHQDAVRAVPQAAHGGLTVARPTTLPLPTIPMPSTAPVPASGGGMMGSASSDDGAGKAPSAAPAATQVHVPPGGDLAARLAAHLTCMQPGTQHDPDLDVRAATLAQQDTASLPIQGAIHIAASDGHHILLGPDMVGGLSIPDGRCGETLIFGVPPLLWLSEGMHFGIGVDQRLDGIVVVVVTR